MVNAIIKSGVKIPDELLSSIFDFCARAWSIAVLCSLVLSFENSLVFVNTCFLSLRSPLHCSPLLLLRGVLWLRGTGFSGTFAAFFTGDIVKLKLKKHLRAHYLSHANVGRNF